MNHGLNPVVKSKHKERMRENIMFQDTKLDHEDMEMLDKQNFSTSFAYDVEEILF